MRWYMRMTSSPYPSPDSRLQYLGVLERDAAGRGHHPRNAVALPFGFEAATASGVIRGFAAKRRYRLNSPRDTAATLDRHCSCLTRIGFGKHSSSVLSDRASRVGLRSDLFNVFWRARHRCLAKETKDTSARAFHLTRLLPVYRGHHSTIAVGVTSFGLRPNSVNRKLRL